MSEESHAPWGAMRPHWFFIMRHLLLGICKILIRMRTEGIDNIPKTGGHIIVSNHLHNLDGVLIDVATPRPVHFMAKSELFANKWLAKLLRWGGVFPIHRGKMDRGALRHAKAVIDHGLILGMFPEGTRSKSMHIERVLPGAGLMAIQNKAPIIPVAITGSERLPFNGNKQTHKNQRTTSTDSPKGVVIRYGKPFHLPEEIDGKRVNAEMAIDLMMKEVAALLPESYRGIYGSEQSQ